MKKSQRTKKLQARLRILRAIDIVIIALPVLVYFVIGVANGDIVTVEKKVALVGAFVVALIFTGVNIVMKMHLKSPIWIAVLGIHFALGNIMPLIWCLAVSTVLDEIVLSPLIKRTKSQVISNKEIDKREAENA